MSEQTAPTEGTENTKNEQVAEFEPITSQEGLDKIIQNRIARERAKFADYDELKAKAEKLSEFEDAQKTAEQKSQERLEAAERRAADLELRSIRAEVAASKGVPVELLSGSTKEELENAADALIEFRGKQEDASPFPKADPSQGARGNQAAGTNADRFASFIGAKLK